jgi:hypothetical protein
MVVGSKLWGVNGVCSTWSCVPNLCLFGVNCGVVHDRGFESLTFWGQWWCSAWSCVPNLCLFGVNCGVVHDRGFEVNCGVVHGLGFESLTFWGSLAENSTFWAK